MTMTNTPKSQKSPEISRNLFGYRNFPASYHKFVLAVVCVALCGRVCGLLFLIAAVVW